MRSTLPATDMPEPLTRFRIADKPFTTFTRGAPMSDTVTVWHPAPELAWNSREVPEADLEAWHNQGWLDEPADEGDGQAEPPRTGPGSGKQAWVAYAESLGYEIGEGDTRDAIISMVDAGPARPQAEPEPAAAAE